MLSLRKEGFAVKIGKVLSKENTGNVLTKIGNLRLKMSNSSVLHVSLLLIILVIAATIRLLPIQWGIQLSEFDPHIHYRVTKHMVDNGFFAWTTWTDTMSWYPNGLEISKIIYPGLAGTAALFYQIASALNLAPGPILSSAVYHPLTADPVFNFVVIFPVIMAVLTVLVIYFVGKDFGGKEVGLFSAFFLALSSAYISRTSLGFFDDETVGIFGILLFIFFFLRSIDTKRSLEKTVTYAAAGGISLGYLFASWGASRYALGITLVFVLVMILIKRYSTRLFVSYSITFALSILIAVMIPRLGVKFLTEPTVLAVVGMFLIMAALEISNRIKITKQKILFIIGYFAIIAVLFFTASSLGLIGSLEGKFESVIIPSERIGEGAVQQLIQSVQEHRPATWGSFYYDLGVGILFIPVALYFIVQNPTNRNIFLAIFGLTAIYFAGSMARLTLLLAPVAAILWAYALVQVVKPFITILREEPKIPRRKMRFRPRVGKEFSAAFIILMFILLTLTFVLPSTPDSSYSKVIERANSPTTIAASSLPLRPNEIISDWLDTLNYLRVNVDDNAVVMAWWDYGYWITAIANKTTLADNGTVNTTQIGAIGRAFISDESQAIEFMKAYDVTHVVVFTSFGTDGQSSTLSDAGYGDEGKWRWMAKIGELNDELYGNYTLGVDWTDTNENGSPDNDELIANIMGNSTVLYKLMHYASNSLVYGSTDIKLEHFKLVYCSQKSENIKWFQDSNGYSSAIVCVYEVIYD
jgi:dolichyl-diphosphooligosaccharide--protein glycosyltransferase